MKKPTRVFLDIETRSCSDLKRVGVHAYAADPSTEIICLAYAIDDGPIRVLDREFDRFQLDDAFLNPSPVEIWAHNAQFEKTLLSRYAVFRNREWRCTMSMALAMGLPGSLKGAAAALGLEVQKDDEGHRLMLQMSRPRSLKPLVWWDDSKKLNRLVEYCKTDVEVTRALAKRLRPLSPSEQKLFAVDLEINDRGVRLDTEAVNWALHLTRTETQRLDQSMRELTEGKVASCASSVSLARWAGVPSVAKGEVADLLAQSNLSPTGRKVLELRQEAAKGSVAKLDRMHDRLPRARGLFQFHGATTGRWAGRAIQPHNMPRPDSDRGMKPEDVDGLLTRRPNRDMIELVWGQPLSVISDCLRGFFVPATGKVFVGADFAQIEARVLAWIAGEDRVTKLYQAGGDAYVDTAAQIFRIPVAKVTKEQRFIGKVAVLSLGYGGGVNAFVKMGKNYGLVLSEEEALPIVQAYRRANSRITGLWREMEGAAIDAVLHPGCVRYPGPAKKGTRFVKNGSFLWLQLPSGRCICYPYPTVQERERHGKSGPSIQYWTSLGTKWLQTDTWGGCLTENLVQAMARDLLAGAILRLEEAGLPVVLHVHDEVVCEVNVNDVDKVLPLVKELPTWAEGLPIDAEVWTGPRYRK